MDWTDREPSENQMLVMAAEAQLKFQLERLRPSFLFRPKLLLDGNQYCALYGEDIMSGCAGFGDTADAAMRDFDKNWLEQKAPNVKEKE